MQHWLIYALGGGWGHLNRAVALGRVAAQKHEVTILTNSPYASFVQDRLQLASLPHLNLIIIPATTPFTDTCAQVRQVVTEIAWNCLIVDTFPRGLGGELADLLPQISQGFKILIHRDLNPAYVRQKQIAGFVSQFFDLVLLPGEGTDSPLATLPQAVITAPWLSRSAPELCSLQAARSLLKIDDSDPVPVLLVCAAGKDSELTFFGKVTMALTQAFPQAMVRCLAATCPPTCPPELWVSHWPGIECLRGADLAIAGAGYNTVYECAALNIPLVAFAFARQYDRQVQRAQAQTYWVKDIPDAIATIQTLLTQIPLFRPDSTPTYTNGVIAALQQIEQLF